MQYVFKHSVLSPQIRVFPFPPIPRRQGDDHAAVLIDSSSSVLGNRMWCSEMFVVCSRWRWSWWRKQIQVSANTENLSSSDPQQRHNHTHARTHQLHCCWRNESTVDMWLYLTSATGSNTFIWNVPLLHLLTCQSWLCAAIGPLAQNRVTHRHHAIGSTELSLKSSPPTPPQGTVGRRWGPIWGHPGSPWSQWQPLSSASPTDQMLLLSRAAWSSLCLGDSFPPITTHHTLGFVHPRTRMLIHVLLSLQRWLPWQQSWLRTRCRGPGEKGKMSPSDVQTLTSVVLSTGTRRKRGKR